MKALLLITGFLIGGLFGYWTRGLTSHPIYNSGVFLSSSHSSGYSLQTFETVNHETPDLLTRVADESAGNRVPTGECHRYAAHGELGTYRGLTWVSQARPRFNHGYSNVHRYAAERPVVEET